MRFMAQKNANRLLREQLHSASARQAVVGAELQRAWKEKEEVLEILSRDKLASSVQLPLLSGYQ